MALQRPAAAAVLTKPSLFLSPLPPPSQETFLRKQLCLRLRRYLGKRRERFLLSENSLNEKGKKCFLFPLPSSVGRVKRGKKKTCFSFSFLPPPTGLSVFVGTSYYPEQTHSRKRRKRRRRREKRLLPQSVKKRGRKKFSVCYYGK